MVSSNATPHWPQIGDILHNHDGYRPPISDELEGASLEIRNGDERFILNFREGRSLEWVVPHRETLAHFRYEALRVRERRFFVSLVDQPDILSVACLWIDLDAGACSIVQVFFDDRCLQSLDLMTRVERTGRQSVARIEVNAYTIGDAQPHSVEDLGDLIGAYMRFQYSDTHIYDHYYVSGQNYLWYCWNGPDAGLGELEEARYVALGDDLYLVVWSEKLLPCAGITVEDHLAMASFGAIVGVDSGDWTLQRALVGSRMERLAHIDPPSTGDALR